MHRTSYCMYHTYISPSLEPKTRYSSIRVYLLPIDSATGVLNTGGVPVQQYFICMMECMYNSLLYIFYVQSIYSSHCCYSSSTSHSSSTTAAVPPSKIYSGSSYSSIIYMIQQVQQVQQAVVPVSLVRKKKRSCSVRLLLYVIVLRIEYV